MSQFWMLLFVFSRRVSTSATFVVTFWFFSHTCIRWHSEPLPLNRNVHMLTYNVPTWAVSCLFMFSYFPPLFKYGRKIIHSTQWFFLRLLANYPRSKSRGFWIWKFFSPIYSKFAVECDWNSKISQIRTKYGFFWIKVGFFAENLIFFSKLVEVANLL